MRIASMAIAANALSAMPLPQRAPCGLHQPGRGDVNDGFELCLSVLHADCINRDDGHGLHQMALPQRAPCGLHR